jgi:hypothetical protein
MTSAVLTQPEYRNGFLTAPIQYLKVASTIGVYNEEVLQGEEGMKKQQEAI